MIRFLHADALDRHPALAAAMFRDRAAQFHRRHGWAVTVDDRGFERDAYDAENPLYVICEDAAGRHAASMRLLPTTARTMVRDHFADLTGGVDITSPLVWETTRFCISPRHARDARRVAGAVMLAGHELGRRFGLLAAVGVFDAHMTRIYRAIGWEPEVLGARGAGRERICAGLWSFSDETAARIAQNAGLDPRDGARWFDAAFPARPRPAAAAA